MKTKIIIATLTAAILAAIMGNERVVAWVLIIGLTTWILTEWHGDY